MLDYSTPLKGVLNVFGSEINYCTDNYLTKTTAKVAEHNVSQILYYYSIGGTEIMTFHSSNKRYKMLM